MERFSAYRSVKDVSEINGGMIIYNDVVANRVKSLYYTHPGTN